MSLDDRRGTFRDLMTWQIAMELTCRIYAITRWLPIQERFGLANQCRRAAVSIPSNIAEGAARRTSAEFLQFLYVARGSLAELRTHLELIERLGLARVDADCHAMADTLGRMLNGLIVAESRARTEVQN